VVVHYNINKEYSENIYQRTNIREKKMVKFSPKMLEPYSEPTTEISTFAVSPLQVIALGTTDKNLSLWNIVSGAHIHDLNGHNHDLTALAFDPQGRILVSGSLDETLRVWDPTKYQQLAQFDNDHDFITGLTFSPAGNLLASGSAKSEIILWDAPRVKQRDTIEDATGDELTSIAFSPDSKTLGFLDEDGTLGFCNLDQWPDITILEDFYTEIMSFAFHPLKNQVAIGGGR